MVTNRQQYREKTSQMISWGHWFALFNIIVGLLIGSRYLFIMDWPSSLFGRLYAFISWIGHFSFIGFAAYLLILFPLTFIIFSQRLLRFVAAIVATAGLTLLILDTEVFSRFYLHLNPIVWDVIINSGQGELTRDWQIMFIAIPIIFLIEMLFGTWSWQKLRSLNRQSFAKHLAIVFISAFCATHLIYIWADANFYRPITMQKSNLPLSHPMTARRFLEKHGFLDPDEYERRLSEIGNPSAPLVEYPLKELKYKDSGSGYNLLVISIDGLSSPLLQQNMPQLTQFAQNNVRFNNHYSSGNRSQNGLFSLFYGISSTYQENVFASHKPPALIDALRSQNYQLGLFTMDGFSTQFIGQIIALPVLPAVKPSISQLTSQWNQWIAQINPQSPWFSYVSYTSVPEQTPGMSEATFSRHYQNNLKKIDNEINQIIQTLAMRDDIDNTVIVITAAHSVDLETQPASGKNAIRERLQVPLLVHWPDINAQTIDKMTGHSDVMATLMQRLLHVANPITDYSQGEELFAPKRNNDWLTVGEGRQLVIITPDRTMVIKSDGQYRSYDLEGTALQENSPPIALILQVLTDMKRFMAD